MTSHLSYQLVEYFAFLPYPRDVLSNRTPELSIRKFIETIGIFTVACNSNFTHTMLQITASLASTLSLLRNFLHVGRLLIRRLHAKHRSILVYHGDR